MNRSTLLALLGSLGLAVLSPGPVIGAGTSDDSTTNEVEMSPGPAVTKESAPFPVSAAWDATFASKYIFLGQDLSDGNPVLQPELVIGAAGFSATLWVNYDLETNYGDEFDVYAQYGRELDRLSVAAGYAHYRYPNRPGWEPSQEVLLDLSFVAPLNPSLSYHYDFDAGKGSYATLGLTHGIESIAHPLWLGTNLFLQRDYYDASGIPALELAAGTEWTLASLTVAPSISYFATWDNGDFSGELATPATWLFAINFAQGL